MKARYLALIPAAVAGVAVARTALMPKKKADYVPAPAEERSLAYAEKLSAMVQCDTTSHANIREPEKFERFHEVLEEQFPLVHRHLERTDIDGNLLYCWKGRRSTDPIVLMSHQDVAHLERHCYQEWLPMKIRPDLLIGVGGTLTTLAAMDLQLAVYDAEKVEGHCISYEALCGHIERLQAMTPEERRHVPGLQPKRSDIIIAGLLIAKSFLQRYQIPAITVSERDLMEGVFFRHSFHDAAWNSRDRQP